MGVYLEMSVMACRPSCATKAASRLCARCLIRSGVFLFSSVFVIGGGAGRPVPPFCILCFLTGFDNRAALPVTKLSVCLLAPKLFASLAETCVGPSSAVVHRFAVIAAPWSRTQNAATQ